ncbi:uncharacterized protein LOC135706290 [Ochlerotatus camptorhynchus]|uniref:uncharacterized protein LOC135706290 n=1 Tax=Ochlerotatus camptorhynchus TaxID=644619 RepID=UPI0031D54A19
MAFKIIAWIVILLVSFDLIRAAPTWYNQESWNYGPDLTYKDYMKKIGAYPRRFRYGTRADPVQKDYGSWFDPYPSWSVYEPVTAQPSQQHQSNWWPSNWNQPGYIRYNDAYEQHAQQQAHQMEQDVAEILWRW